MIARGLTELDTDQLTDLLRKVHHGTLPCPFSRATLLSMGLNVLAERGDLLFGLEARAVRAVLTAVIAERRPRRA